MKTGFRLTPDRGTRQATVNARLASGLYDEPCILAVAAGDLLDRERVAFNREDSAAWHEPECDLYIADDLPSQRVIPAPGTNADNGGENE